MYGVSWMFSILFQTAQGTLNSEICTADSFDKFIIVFNKKLGKLFLFVQYNMYKEEEDLGFLEYSCLRTKTYRVSQ